MTDTLISGIFVTGIYGYGIFGQKMTGIRDIKTPPNGASTLLEQTKSKLVSNKTTAAFL